MRRALVVTIAVAVLAQGYARGSAGARDPVWSPDGKRIAVSYLDRIWTMSPDGREPRPLGSDDAAVARSFVEREPSWSHDGRRVAYASDRHGSFDLFVAAAGGGAPTRVTSLAGDERWPSWTRDGRLVFSYAHDGDWDVYVVDVGGAAGLQASGSTPRPLDGFADPDLDELQARVSPDGARVVFVSDRDSEDGDRDLWVRELDQKPDVPGTPGTSGSVDGRPEERRKREPIRVTRVRGEEQAPSWSPDGTRVAYCAVREGLGSVWVSAVDARGDAGDAIRARPAGGPVLVSRHGGAPAWSPDGRTILIAALPDPDPVYNGNPLRSAAEPPPLFAGAAFDLWTVAAPIEVDERARPLALPPAPPARWLSAFDRVWQTLDDLSRRAPGARFAVDADSFHHMIKAWKVRDSIRRIADPERWPIELGNHLEPSHAAELFGRIDPARASRFRNDPDDDPVRGERIGRGTTAFAVGDAQGNLIAVTQTLSTWGGNFYVSRGLGFLYNNHLRSNRTTPGAYGQLLPLSRSSSTSAPTLIFRRSAGALEPRLAVAAAGNAWITASVYSVIANVVDSGMEAQRAVEAPRFLIGRDPADEERTAARVQIEDRFPRAIVGDLQRRGHRFQKIGRKGELRYGYAAAVTVDASAGRVEAGAEPRRSHAAAAPGAAATTARGR